MSELGTNNVSASDSGKSFKKFVLNKKKLEKMERQESSESYTEEEDDEDIVTEGKNN